MILVNINVYNKGIHIGIFFSIILGNFLTLAAQPFDPELTKKVEQFGKGNLLLPQPGGRKADYGIINMDSIEKKAVDIYFKSCSNVISEECKQSVPIIEGLMKEYCTPYPHYCERLKGKIINQIGLIDSARFDEQQKAIWDVSTKYLFECKQNPYGSECVLLRDSYIEKVNNSCEKIWPYTVVNDNSRVTMRINNRCKQIKSELEKHLMDPTTSTQDFLDSPRDSKQTAYKLRKDLKFYYFAGEKYPEDSDLYKRDIKILDEVLRIVPPKYISQLNHIILTDKIIGVTSDRVTVGRYEPSENSLYLLRSGANNSKKLISTIIHEFGHVFTANQKVTCNDIRPGCFLTPDHYGFEAKSFPGRYYKAFDKNLKTTISFVSPYAKTNIFEDMAETFTVAVERKNPFEKPAPIMEKSFVTGLIPEFLYKPKEILPTKESGFRRLKIGFFLSDPQLRGIILNFKDRQDPVKRKKQDDEFSKS